MENFKIENLPYGMTEIIGIYLNYLEIGGNLNKMHHIQTKAQG